MEETRWLKPSGKRVTKYGDSASVQAVTQVNAEQASKRTMRRPTRLPFRGRLTRLGGFEQSSTPGCEQYAYRPGRNAQQAVVEVEELLLRGHPEVVDADLADYFGSIPHAELMRSLARRIVDRRLLHLCVFR
jgi:hypothetical protein